MFSPSAVLVVLLAFGIPVYLLYRFHAGWYWHVLSTMIAIGMGFIRVPDAWHTAAFDLAFVGTFVFCLVWGVGGMFAFRHHHHEKHA